MSIYGIPARFGEKAKNEWASALNEWVKFGEHVFMSHNEVPDATGKLHRDPIKIDDASNPERLEEAHRQPEVLDAALGRPDELPVLEGAVPGRADRRGGPAHELFYQGTLAYKTGDFTKAAAKYREGLQFWKLALNDHPTFRDDDLCKKDTGLIIKRYVRALQQADEPMPDDTPFKDTLAVAQNDPTVDPFDAIEMIGVPGGMAADSGGAPARRRPRPRPPGSGPGR